uniref:Bromodomain associated domain-containing protein n=1 Tax=Ditylenchus dipsaci TaxID=166011 RepID=A0A915D0X3_9BILA
MKPDVFAHKMLTKSVAAMVNNVGFTHTSQSSLSMLSGLTKAFMDGLARCCIEHTELGQFLGAIIEKEIEQLDSRSA